jgi:uncharacterized protein with ATP-grasp and redox domains
MNTYLECYPCFVRQALDASRNAGASEDQQHKVLQRVLGELRSFDKGATPPEMAYRIHRAVREETGEPDPFRAAKDSYNAEALSLYPRLKAVVTEAPDPLGMALRVSIAGNIMDVGVPCESDVEQIFDEVFNNPPDTRDFHAFQDALAGVGDILYLADNTGETVFDRVLIETIGKSVAYVVKSGPILNDATMSDAVAAGLGEVATLVESGSDAPGTILERCSGDLRRRFADAELIIAKGQANYETLSEMAAPIFFLLHVKCPVVARDLDIPVRTAVLKRSRHWASRSFRGVP